MLVNPATSPRWRAVRGWAFAAMASMLAAAGHTIGGGMMPDPAALISGAGLLGLVVSALGRRRLRLPAVIALLAGGQLTFHLLFSLTEHSGHEIDLARMILFHLAAGLLTAAVLAGAERALFGLLNRLRVWSLWLTAPSALPDRAKARPTFRPNSVLRVVGIRSGTPRRGPPRGTPRVARPA